jgi:hypothetical protein
MKQKYINANIEMTLQNLCIGLKKSSGYGLKYEKAHRKRMTEIIPLHQFAF